MILVFCRHVKFISTILQDISSVLVYFENIDWKSSCTLCSTKRLMWGWMKIMYIICRRFYIKFLCIIEDLKMWRFENLKVWRSEVLKICRFELLKIFFFLLFQSKIHFLNVLVIIFKIMGLLGGALCRSVCFHTKTMFWHTLFTKHVDISTNFSKEFNEKFD